MSILYIWLDAAKTELKLKKPLIYSADIIIIIIMVVVVIEGGD